jgi:hypothetical protein
VFIYKDFPFWSQSLYIDQNILIILSGEDMEKLYQLLDGPIDSLDESIRPWLMSIDIQLMQKGLSKPPKDIPDCTMKAISSTIERCIKDPGYIFKLEKEGFSAYELLKTYPKAILRGIDVLFSDNKELRVKIPLRLKKDTDLDILDFKIVHRAFSQFVHVRGYRTREEKRGFVKELRRDLYNLLELREVNEELADVRDFFNHLHKYRQSKRYRLSC